MKVPVAAPDQQRWSQESHFWGFVFGTSEACGHKCSTPLFPREKSAFMFTFLWFLSNMKNILFCHSGLVCFVCSEWSQCSSYLILKMTYTNDTINAGLFHFLCFLGNQPEEEEEDVVWEFITSKRRGEARDDCNWFQADMWGNFT